MGKQNDSRVDCPGTIEVSNQAEAKICDRLDKL